MAEKRYNVCIVGGGSTYTPGFLKSFVRLQKDFPLSRLVLFDIDGPRQEPVGKFGEILFHEMYPDAEISYTTDEKTAYTGMDFIFMQMRSGGLEGRWSDEHTCFDHGIIGQELSLIHI